MRRSDPKISVETVGYYHADCKFYGASTKLSIIKFQDTNIKILSNATPDLLPKRLNDNKRFFENPNLDIPLINLDIPLPEMVNNKENNLKSMLDYIRQKGWPNGDLPDFVTHKQLLQKIASTYEEMEIYVVKVNGVIFMYKNNEMEPRLANFLWVFRHHLIRETEDEPIETDGTIRKGVFNASIDMGDGGKRENILYSGKIDLIDDKDRHNDVKVVVGAGNYFWDAKSNFFYWQSFFGNSTHILIGIRTGVYPKDKKTWPPKSLPHYSVFKVQKMSLAKLYQGAKARLNKFPDKKQIDDGYEDIRGFLSLIREHVKNDGDGFVFSRNEGGGEWTIRRDDEAVADFKNEISRNIPNYNAIPNLLPKRLNDYKKYFDNPNLDIPFIDVDITLPPMPREKEYNLKSLLNYLRQKGWPNGDLPDFVTHKHLLHQITSVYKETEIYVVKLNGVIFMYENDEEPSSPSSFSWIFRQYLTRNSRDEQFDTDGIVRKGVFKASIYMGSGRKRETILYSGKVDLIDGEHLSKRMDSSLLRSTEIIPDNDQHNEVKVVTGDGPLESYFWEERSNRFYWQAFFGNSTHLLLGMRTYVYPKDPKTRPPQCFPPLSVYKVQKMDLTDLYDEAKHRLKEFPHKKQMRDGYEDLRGLLSLIREHVKKDGDGFVFSRNEGISAWRVRRNNEALADFKNEILRNIPMC
ncbi:hypothetical protein CAEBREN_26063 [Caenorhabditis brenneri]|uniref:Decapping nuclease n=1 Tax=Caenorhabditis brenneri TaxID=135651 RepID=G0NTQ9_CAEBE|nr:hypothetical protein CAEBREN_26063 [Caenorhabditis brenneri]